MNGTILHDMLFNELETLTKFELRVTLYRKKEAKTTCLSKVNVKYPVQGSICSICPII